ncbi:hypothetical protein V2A60_005804 [Cordyceps javanica]
MLQAAFTPIIGDRVARNTGSDAQMLPFLPGLCFAAAAGKTLDRSQTVEANDTLLRVAADVLQAFVRDGHGSTIKDVAKKQIDPRDVEGLHQGLALWGLDDMEGLGGHRGPQRRGGGMEELEALLRMLRPN